MLLLLFDEAPLTELALLVDPLVLAMLPLLFGFPWLRKLPLFRLLPLCTGPLMQGCGDLKTGDL